MWSVRADSCAAASFLVSPQVMPVFEFECEACGREYEELVLRADEVIQCPCCGSDRARKLMSSFAVGGEARKAGGGGCGSCRPAAGKCGSCKCH